MKELLCAGVVALSPGYALAQAHDASLATPVGHEVNVGVGHYTYKEPGAQAISISGTKIEGDYTGTLSLTKHRDWFARANLRGTIGNVTYDGWCSPFLIAPNAASPNGYELDLGDASPCTETGDRDWYVEARALVGKDFVGRQWGVSPETGLGLRHLSNGINGVAGYRTDDYLYLPLALTARTWSVGASPKNDETATFTVNRVTARELLGAYEPSNVTNEVGVRIGLRF